MGAFLPGRVEAVEQRQQQAAQVEDQRRISANLPCGTKVINLSIQQEVSEVQRQQQKHFALAAIHQAKRAAE